MFARPASGLTQALLYTLAVLVFLFVAVVRYNAPEGSFGGLTDDHFFFATQAWQMLFGEWPDRDYFEPGAPLTLGISAALQVVLGRSVWSEFVFCVVALALGSAITFVLAARASGSILLGLGAFLFQFALLPRLYGYPKILIYAAGIGAMWAWASAPVTRRSWGLAVVIALAFLLRHDHGVYLGFGFAVLLLTLGSVPWLVRVRQAAFFGLALVVCLAPYFVYLQLNGGIERHFVTTYAWSARDFSRSPRVLPDVEWRPLFEDVDTDAPASEWWEHAPFAVLAEYSTFWLFWLFMALPILALLMLAATPAMGPPGWTQERAKVAAVIAVAVAVNYGFLRGNLAGRLADVSVPMVILAAWLLARALPVVRTGRAEVFGRQRVVGSAVRAGLVIAALVLVGVTTVVLVRPFRAALENGRVGEGIEGMRAGAESVTERLQHTWPLDVSASESRADFLLARYLQSCTASTDRVLLTEFRSQILGLAQRGFAAGHVDLRGGGFFGSLSEQQLTVERWQRQSVPVVIGPTEEDYRDWVESLPIVAQYLNREYRSLGEQDVGGFRFLLFVRRDARVVRTHEALGFPCFR